MCGFLFQISLLIKNLNSIQEGVEMDLPYTYHGFWNGALEPPTH